MSDLFDSKNPRSVLTEPNSQKNFHRSFPCPAWERAMIFLLIILTGTVFQAAGAGSRPEKAEDILNQLVSPDEAERFKAMDKIKGQEALVTVRDIEQSLASLRKKNVSTLIFVLMEKGSDILYRAGIPAKMTLENSEGSFPNIAYYYAKIQPEKGLKELYRLYGKHSNERMAICKALGEVGVQEAMDFLMTEALREKRAGNSIIAHLAGLQHSGRIMEQSKIGHFLEQNLDREEIILLSRFNTDLDSDKLRAFYTEGGRKKTYAVEYVFREPGVHFNVLCFMTDTEIEKQNYDTVLQWMMSDSIRQSKDERVRQYRESVLARIRKD